MRNIRHKTKLWEILALIVVIAVSMAISHFTKA